MTFISRCVAALAVVLTVASPAHSSKAAVGKKAARFLSDLFSPRNLPPALPPSTPAWKIYDGDFFFGKKQGTPRSASFPPGLYDTVRVSVLIKPVLNAIMRRLIERANALIRDNRKWRSKHA